MQLDQAVIVRLSKPINAVWQEISSDVYSCAAEMGESVTNSEAIESCIDADRMTTIARDKEADDIVGALCIEHTYQKLHKFLCKHIKLA